MTDDALAQSGSTSLTQIINNNKEWFTCGLMYPDVTVIYYYTQFISYTATHNIGSFYKALWEDAQNRGSPQAKAFALGVGTHLIQDSVSHNLYIPTKIRSLAFLPFATNNILHPTLEAIVEGWVIENATTKARAEVSFAVWDTAFNDAQMSGLTPVRWADNVLGRSGSDSFQDEAQLFNGILSGHGFSGSFMGYSFGKTSGLLWDVFRGASSLLKNFIPKEDSKSYTDLAIAVTVEWYKSGDGSASSLGAYVRGDPTGIQALTDADSFVGLWSYAILAIVVVVIIAIVVWKRDKVKAGASLVTSKVRF